MAKAQLAWQTLEVNLSLQDANRASDLAEKLKIPPVILLSEEIIHRYLGGKLFEKQS